MCLNNRPTCNQFCAKPVQSCYGIRCSVTVGLQMSHCYPLVKFLVRCETFQQPLKLFLVVASIIAYSDISLYLQCRSMRVLLLLLYQIITIITETD